MLPEIERSYIRVFHVSPVGDDGADGSEANPFRTLARARDAVREVNGDMSGDILVRLRGGVYPVTEAIVFDERDSGANGFRVVYAAYPGELPTISGGTALAGWRKTGNLRWSCDIGSLRFRQLYVGGRRAIRARTPNKGQQFRVIRWDRANREIIVDRDDIGDWRHFQDVEMVIQQYWAESTVRLAGFTVEGREARIKLQETEADILFDRPFPPHKEGQYYHFENAFEFVDSEGEWFADRSDGQLHYIPRDGEKLDQTEAVVPVAETLIRIEGSLARPVHHITFCGIAFKHTTWLRPSEKGNLTAQAGQFNISADTSNNQNVGRPPAAVYVACAQHVRFERNEFRHMGATALDFHYGTLECEAEGNLIEDVSGNGISLGKFNDPEVEFHNVYNPEDTREIATGDRIRNNVIRRIGQDYYGSVGIGAGYVRNASIAHNDLCDMPYTGISLGWGWLHVDSASAGNRIVNNRVVRTMGLLCDGAGIYTLSKQPGSEISGNWITDIKRSEWAGSFPVSSIYLDEGSEGFRIFNNHSRYSTPEDIHLHQTGDNIIANYAASPQAVNEAAGLTEEYRDLLGRIAEKDPGAIVR